MPETKFIIEGETGQAIQAFGDLKGALEALQRSLEQVEGVQDILSFPRGLIEDYKELTYVAATYLGIIRDTSSAFSGLVSQIQNGITRMREFHSVANASSIPGVPDMPSTYRGGPGLTRPPGWSRGTNDVWDYGGGGGGGRSRGGRREVVGTAGGEEAAEGTARPGREPAGSNLPAMMIYGSRGKFSPRLFGKSMLPWYLAYRAYNFVAENIQTAEQARQSAEPIQMDILGRLLQDPTRAGAAQLALFPNEEADKQGSSAAKWAALVASNIGMKPNEYLQAVQRNAQLGGFRMALETPYLSAMERSRGINLSPLFGAWTQAGAHSGGQGFTTSEKIPVLSELMNLISAGLEMGDRFSDVVDSISSLTSVMGRVQASMEAENAIGSTFLAISLQQAKGQPNMMMANAMSSGMAQGWISASQMQDPALTAFALRAAQFVPNAADEIRTGGWSGSMSVLSRIAGTPEGIYAAMKQAAIMSQGSGSPQAEMDNFTAIMLRFTQGQMSADQIRAYAHKNGGISGLVQAAADDANRYQNAIVGTYVTNADARTARMNHTQDLVSAIMPYQQRDAGRGSADLTRGYTTVLNVLKDVSRIKSELELQIQGLSHGTSLGNMSWRPGEVPSKNPYGREAMEKYFGHVFGRFGRIVVDRLEVRNYGTSSNAYNDIPASGNTVGGMQSIIWSLMRRFWYPTAAMELQVMAPEWFD